jgi:hypothetical protein
MFEIACYVIALTTAAWAIRVRRFCWHISWERTTTSAIAQLALALVLIAPAAQPVTGRLFWEVTGYWHLDDLLGHILELGALVSSNIAGMMRMPSKRRYIEPLLWQPLVVGTAVLMMLFLRSRVTHDPGHDLFRLPHEGWLTAYWAVLVALLVYYCGLNAWIARVHLRADPRAKTVALAWLACVGLGAIAVTGWLLPALHVIGYADYGRLAMCACVTVFSFISARSWRRKLAPYRDLIKATGSRL